MFRWTHCIIIANFLCDNISCILIPADYDTLPPALINYSIENQRFEIANEAMNKTQEPNMVVEKPL